MQKYNNFKVYFSFSNKENKNYFNRYVLSLNIFKENSYNIIFKNYSGITASDLTGLSHFMPRNSNNPNLHKEYLTRGCLKLKKRKRKKGKEK